MKAYALVFGAAVVLALFQGQTVSGQETPAGVILYQNWNYTTMTAGYSSCSTDNPVVTTATTNTSDNTLVPVTEAQAQATTVDGIWFGGGVGQASVFKVVGNCSALQLTVNGGHGTTIYTGPVPLAPNGCSGQWYQSTDYLHMFVNITNTGYGWTVSLPTNNTVRAQASCNGGYQFCPLSTGIKCDTVLNLDTVLKPDGSPSPAAEKRAASLPTTVQG